MVAMHLSTKFGGYTFIQSGDSNIFLKFNMAAAAVLDFHDKRMCHVPPL